MYFKIKNTLKMNYYYKLSLSLSLEHMYSASCGVKDLKM